jgi:flagellin
MSNVTVNTNYSALVALQNLNKTNQEMESVQNRINTGLKVADARDNGAVFAIAQTMRGKVSAYGVAAQTLDKAISTLDVSIAAANTLSDLLNQMKEKATAARDTTLSTAQRAAYNADFAQLRDQIVRTVANAEFNGHNLISASGESVTAFANDTGSSLITITATSLALGGSVVTVGVSEAITTATLAIAALSRVDASITNLNTQLARFGSGANALETHRAFVGKLTDALESGLGNLVDADLAKESARLQALQVKQQLGSQALTIANRAPQIILSFFQGG